MIKRAIQEDITVITTYGPNIKAPKFIRQITDIKGEIDSKTITIGDFNSTFKSSRQKIHRDTLALNDTFNQMDLLDSNRIFHPKAAEYTFFLNTWETFSRSDYMLATKKSLINLIKLK